MALAPIILFVYNRPDMVEQTLRSLQKNALATESELFIYADGPKADASSEQLNKIAEVRKLIRKEQWCGKVNIVEREKNMGLANSVISGVSEMVEKYGRTIVMEDDIQVSPFFLNFMNDALDLYEHNEKILAVASWNYFASGISCTNDHFFFRYPDSIAWATYKRSWNLFEKDAKQAYTKLKEKGKLQAFNGDGHALYFENMLQMQIEGKINSWAIRWTATAVLNDMLTVFPKLSMSKHLGFGAEATHEKTEIDYNANLTVSDRKLNLTEATAIEEDKNALEKWVEFVKTNFVPAPEKPVTLMYRIKRKLKRILKLS